MILNSSKNSQEVDMQLIMLKDQQNQLLRGLFRHYTGLSATLLALLVVFLDIRQGCLLVRIPVALSMTFLLAAVMAGIWCLQQGFHTNRKALGRLSRISKEETGSKIGFERPHKYFESIAIFCPIALGLGVLFLWVSGLLILFFQ